MIKIRQSLFETNSSSTNSFSHSNDCCIPGTMSFILKVKCDINDKLIEDLRNQFINWLNSKYSKAAKIESFELTNESESGEISTYLIKTIGNFYIKINVYVRQFYKSSYGEQEPDEYWVKNYCTDVNKDNEVLTDLFREYLEQNYEGNVIVVEVKKENSDFEQDELEKHIWEENDSYDDYDYDDYDDFDYDYRHK